MINKETVGKEVLEKKHRVLVADTDPRQRRMTAIVLRLLGYEVIETSQGLNVLNDGRRGAFDAVVMETRLSDGDAIDLVQVLRKQEETKSIPILILTSETTRQQEIERVLGPNTFIAKPAMPSVLANHLASLLDSKT